jgi:hypothetical protein
MIAGVSMFSNFITLLLFHYENNVRCGFFRDRQRQTAVPEISQLLLTGRGNLIVRSIVFPEGTDLALDNRCCRVERGLLARAHDFMVHLFEFHFVSSGTEWLVVIVLRTAAFKTRTSAHYG